MLSSSLWINDGYPFGWLSRAVSCCCPSRTNRHLCAAVSCVDVSKYCIFQVDIPLVEANECMIRRVNTGYSWFTGHTRLQVICMTEHRLLLHCFHTAPSLIVSRIFIAQGIARFYGIQCGTFSGQNRARIGRVIPRLTKIIRSGITFVSRNFSLSRT